MQGLADGSDVLVQGTAARQEVDAQAQIPATAHLSLISNLQGFLALREQWQALEKAACTSPTVFQSFDWLAAWCKTYCAPGHGADIQILAGFNNGKLVFAWPLAVQRPMGLRVLTWLSEPFGQYGDVICSSDEQPKLWIAAALHLLRRLNNIDMLRLRHVRNDSTLATVAAQFLVNARFDERAPYLDLTAFASESAYEERYTGTQRKRRKKIRKKLEELGPVSFTRLPLGAQSDRAIDEAIAEKNKWLAERGRMNLVLNCPGHAGFLKQLSRSAEPGLDMVVTEMKAGERALSWEIAFRFAGVHFAYITSHANELTDLSPGRLHFDYSQRACLSAGLSRFDLMVPYDAHKESWSSGCVPTEDYFLPLSRKGYWAGHVYLRHIRPALRNVYYRLPASVLRLINGSVHSPLP